MKPLLIILPLLIALTLGTGCSTTGGGSGTSLSPEQIANISFYLKATAANGVLVAISEDTNSIPYVRLVREALLKVRGGDKFTPGALEDALKAVNTDGLGGKWGPLIVANISLAYELFWAEKIRDSVNRGEVAVAVIDGIVAGVDLGLAGQIPGPPRHLRMNKTPINFTHIQRQPDYAYAN